MWEVRCNEALVQIYGYGEERRRVVATTLSHVEGTVDALASLDRDPYSWEWIDLGGRIVALAPPPRKQDVHSLLCRKHTDYGHRNIAKFGARGILVRISDKVARLQNLAGKPGLVTEDTVLDLIGYCAIGVMWECGHYMEPMGNLHY